MSDRERWDRIKAVFQAALERAPHERAEFLRETCGADGGLSAEVESLLSAHELAGTFVERPAIETLSTSAARVLDTAGRTLRRGERFGPYEIAEFISAGGMGEVYRARDPKLARDVAIKIDGEQEPATARLVASKRQVFGIRRTEPDNELGPGDPADGGRRGVGLEAWKARSLLEHAFCGARADVLARRAVDRVSLARVRTE